MNPFKSFGLLSALVLSCAWFAGSAAAAPATDVDDDKKPFWCQCVGVAWIVKDCEEGWQGQCKTDHCYGNSFSEEAESAAAPGAFMVIGWCHTRSNN